jgi:hypothetical protein
MRNPASYAPDSRRLLVSCGTTLVEMDPTRDDEASVLTSLRSAAAVVARSNR